MISQAEGEQTPTPGRRETYTEKTGAPASTRPRSVLGESCDRGELRGETVTTQGEAAERSPEEPLPGGDGKAPGAPCGRAGGRHAPSHTTLTTFLSKRNAQVHAETRSGQGQAGGDRGVGPRRCPGLRRNHRISSPRPSWGPAGPWGPHRASHPTPRLRRLPALRHAVRPGARRAHPPSRRTRSGPWASARPP